MDNEFFNAAFGITLGIGLGVVVAGVAAILVGCFFILVGVIDPSKGKEPSSE